MAGRQASDGGNELVFKPSPLKVANVTTPPTPAATPAPASGPRDDVTYFIPGSLEAAPAPFFAPAEATVPPGRTPPIPHPGSATGAIEARRPKPVGSWILLAAVTMVGLIIMLGIVA